MATILEFRQGQERAVMPLARYNREQGAEIVIFPGVRIERCDEGPDLSGLRPLEDDDDECQG